MKLFRKWRQRRLERAIDSGKKQRGRQPEKDSGGGVKAKAEPLATIKVRVQRAGSDQWEDVG